MNAEEMPNEERSPNAPPDSTESACLPAPDSSNEPTREYAAESPPKTRIASQLCARSVAPTSVIAPSRHASKSPEYSPRFESDEAYMPAAPSVQSNQPLR